MSRSNKVSKRADPIGRRLALLICYSKFLNWKTTLPGPVKDAKNMEAALSNPETCKFQVTVFLNRRLIEVRREIARICADAGEQDTLLIYYSGNGFTGPDNSFYLAVVDSDRNFPHATALDAEFILTQLRNSRCRRIVLIVDGCHSGAFFEHNRGIPNGLFAITSCAADQVTGDTAEGGVFSLALCSGLNDAAADANGDGLVSIDELFEFVKQKLQGNEDGSIPQKWEWNVQEPIFITAVPRHIFLSYSRKDSAEADKLEQRLRAQGLPIWVDRHGGIESGNWKDRVTAGLNHARALIVLLTPASLESSAVRKEMAFASRKSVPIIPVQLKEIPEEEIPDWFTLDYDELHRHMIDPTRYEEGVTNIVNAIGRLRKQKERRA
jgi:hypothetical protein